MKRAKESAKTTLARNFVMCTTIPTMAALNEARRLDPGLRPHDAPEYQGLGPEQRACYGADALAELVAEAIRAYMQNPNYLKTVAPNVAARIRAAVNTNPNLNRIIQFN